MSRAGFDMAINLMAKEKIDWELNPEAATGAGARTSVFRARSVEMGGLTITGTSSLPSSIASSYFMVDSDGISFC